MRLKKLHLKAFGPFTDRVLDFGDARGLVMLYGPNEAGKSSALRAISDLRFGIEPQSRDNFVHTHPEMKVGGEFVDRNGKEYSFLRRKGRGVTLLFADFGTSDAPTTAVPAEIEALLTCGLNRKAYDAMFGLDHQRLREGGQALLKGEGDVGAALFEASSGVRSIPRVLDTLEASSRKLFMPGARGRNARINEMLKAYDEQHAQLRRAQLRPSQWADILRKHQGAAADLAELERRRDHLSSSLLLTNELRAVAPLLSTLDNAMQVLQTLKAVPLLDSNASTDRAAAESGLSAANHNASMAEAEAVRQQLALDNLILDEDILAVGPSVRRLAVSAEAIDQLQRAIAEAELEVREETQQVSIVASQIDASLSPEAVLARTLSKTQKIGIEQVIGDFELAQHTLEQHLHVGRQGEENDDRAATALPPSEARTALRVAQAEIARANGDLKRLAALPAEIKAARRAVSASLKALGLEDGSTLGDFRQLLDAQIDSAMKDQNAHQTRREGVQARIQEISNALPAISRELERLLESGAVATRDEVEVARAHRESGWKLVRGVYIDGTNPKADDFSGGKPLAQAYEAAVVQADQRVDELAGDTERAARVQACKHEVQTLESDRAELQRQLEEMDNREGMRLESWAALLSEAKLPEFSPAALRDWQALLPAARTALETLESKLDELERVQAIEQELTVDLHAAIVGTGLAVPAASETLRTLAALAGDLEENVKQREAAINTAAGKKTERESQRQQRAIREEALKTTVRSAHDALKRALAMLLLPGDASVSVARARLVEFEDLVEAKSRVAAAEANRARAGEALSLIKDSAAVIWRALGDAEPEQVRLYVDQTVTRLDSAEAVQRARDLAKQARDRAVEDQRIHGSTASLHQNALVALCALAQVESANLLPEAEEQSRRKREAQVEIDRSRQQLALASRRTIDELRTLLAPEDLGKMDANEVSWTAEQDQIVEKIRVARQREEEARRELEAIDGSDAAAAARDAMERASAAVRVSMPQWIRTKIARSLLAEALKGFRERAQGPMLKAASGYFARMTLEGFTGLLNDDASDEPVLIAQRSNGSHVHVEELSEGTRDQLYLALRLAALDIRRAAGVELPVILDDILITSDDARSGAMLMALADFARENQVMVFTHHQHIAEMAARYVPSESLAMVEL